MAQKITSIIDINLIEFNNLINSQLIGDDLSYIKSILNLKGSKEIQALLIFNCDVSIALNPEKFKLKVESIYPISMLYDIRGNIIDVIQFKNEKNGI